MTYISKYNSPMGEILMESDGTNLTGLWLVGQKYFNCEVEENVTINDNLKIFKQVKLWLDDYFNGKTTSIKNLPLAPQGNEFRIAVWEILKTIDYGKTCTYGEIAKQIAKKFNKKSMSAQAVGNAVGHNPISIIIPCHRVIGANGNLTGYAGGLDKKIKLLEIEGHKIAKNKVIK